MKTRKCYLKKSVLFHHQKSIISNNSQVIRLSLSGSIITVAGLKIHSAPSLGPLLLVITRPVLHPNLILRIQLNITDLNCNCYVETNSDSP